MKANIYHWTVVMMLFAGSIYSQVAVNVNIGAPAWGPPVANTVEYYYLPDVHSYYDIRNRQFIYYTNNKWVRAKALPARYKHYDLHKGRTIVLTDYHGPSPFHHYKAHKVKYHHKHGPKHKGHPGHKHHGKGKGKGHHK